MSGPAGKCWKVLKIGCCQYRSHSFEFVLTIFPFHAAKPIHLRVSLKKRLVAYGTHIFRFCPVRQAIRFRLFAVFLSSVASARAVGCRIGTATRSCSSYQVKSIISQAKNIKCSRQPNTNILSCDHFTKVRVPLTPICGVHGFLLFWTGIVLTSSHVLGHLSIA